MSPAAGGVLALGEALVEFVRPERDVPLDRPGTMLGPFASGAPAIYASVAARLGAAVALCAVVGDDPFGQLLTERLRRDGVSLDGVRVAVEAPTATAHVAYSSDGDRTFVFHVADAAAGRLTADDLGDLPERAAWLHVSGSSIALGPGLADAVERAVERVRAAGGKVSLDPNVRPEAMSPRLGERIGAIARTAHVLFPSEHELEALGLDADALAAAGSVVCTTLGEHGVRVLAGGRSVRVEAPRTEGVDPTGAGDHFAAAFTVATLAGAEPVEAATVACRVAACSVQAMGPMEAAVEPAALRAIRR